MADFDLDELDAHESTIYGLRHDMTVAYINAEWRRFAVDNQAPREIIDPECVMERNILGYFYGPLRDYYHDVFTIVLDESQSFALDYECSSPEKIRLFHMEILPLPRDSDEPRGLLIVNSHSPSSQPSESRQPVTSPEATNYISEQGLMASCSNCRRFRRCDHRDRWDWVPQYLTAPPAPVSHGLCPVCLDYYYPATDHTK